MPRAAAEHEREREVRRGLGEHVRRDAHGDAALVGGVEVDVVAADGVVGHDLQVGQRVEEVRVDALGQQRDEPLGALRAVAQLLVGGRQIALPDVDVVAFRRRGDQGVAGRAGG